MHPGASVSGLSSHALQSQGKRAVSEVLLEREEVHYLLASGVVEHGLGLQDATIWEVEVAHGHTCLVGGEPQDGGLHLVWVLVGISCTGIDTACNLKAGTLLVREHPLSSQLEIVTKRKHHIKVETIDCLVLLENSTILHDFLERIWL